MRRRFFSAACAAFLTSGPGLAQEEQLAGPQAGDTAGPDSPIAEEVDTGFFSVGYFRFGVGSTNGDEMVAFRLNGAGSKYRLGNESDLYGEASIGYRYAFGNGSTFITEFMVNGWANSNALLFDVPFDEDGGVVQAYAGVENIGSGVAREAFAWGGRRYYRRRDVHITDFYYENFSGDGIGLENLRIGDAGLSTAFFYYDDDNADFESRTVDVRLHDVPVGGGWLGEIGLAWLDGSGADADDGYSARLHMDNLELSWGEWRNAFMYGQGIGIDFTSTGAVGVAGDDSRFRYVTQAMILTSDTFQTQATAVYQTSDIGGVSQQWASAGLRPQYNFTDDWGLAVELGVDWFDTEGQGSQSLSKLTIAPFYSFGKVGFFARPQLRAFVTMAQWNEDGAITDQASLGSSTDGTTVGIQIENWW